MKRQIITTKDGSKTIHLPEWNENYHSHHGAVQEAVHVFIKSGLNHVMNNPTLPISILEVGFGSGLNAILTLIEANNNNLKIEYEGLEAYPLSLEEVESLGYDSLREVIGFEKEYEKMHVSEWGKKTPVNTYFRLLKTQAFLLDFQPEKERYNLVYFDAFGPRVQPELWDIRVFQKIFSAMHNNGVLVTYCAKGQVRRDLIEVGFSVEKIPGPPGKREMLRATKIIE